MGAEGEACDFFCHLVAEQKDYLLEQVRNREETWKPSVTKESSDFGVT